MVVFNIFKNKKLFKVAHNAKLFNQSKIFFERFFGKTLNKITTKYKVV